NKTIVKRKGFPKDEDPPGGIKTPPPSPRPFRKVKNVLPAQKSSPFCNMEAAEAVPVENKTIASRKGFLKDENPPGGIKTPPPSPVRFRKIKDVLPSVEKGAKTDTISGASTKLSVSNHGSGSDSDTNYSSSDNNSNDNASSSNINTNPGDYSDAGDGNTELELDDTSSSSSSDGNSLDGDYCCSIVSDSDGRRNLDDGNGSDTDCDNDLGEIGQMVIGESPGSRHQANQPYMADRGLW
ncbi:hypothetical protein BGZ89_007034, partial [Linnemannia elongata]